MSYTPSAWEKALYRWLVAIIDDPAVPVIYANQNAPRAPQGFVLLQIISKPRLGSPHLLVKDEALGSGFKGVQRTDYRGVAQVDTFGPSHHALAARVAEGDWLPAGIAALDDEPVSVANVSTLTNAPEQLGASWGQRSALEVVFLFASEIEFESDVIETADTTLSAGA